MCTKLSWRLRLAYKYLDNLAPLFPPFLPNTQATTVPQYASCSGIDLGARYFCNIHCNADH
jgi:hypothetical protein